MNTYAAWFNSKSFSAHTIAITAFALAGIVASDKQVQAWVTQVCGAHVGLAAEIVGFCIIIANYRHSSSEAGTVANVKAIMNQPAPPTAEQIAAASTK